MRNDSTVQIDFYFDRQTGQNWYAEISMGDIVTESEIEWDWVNGRERN